MDILAKIKSDKEPLQMEIYIISPQYKNLL